MPYILNRLDGARMRIPIDVATKTFQLAESTSFVLTCSDSELQVTDNSTTVFDGQAPQVTD